MRGESVARHNGPEASIMESWFWPPDFLSFEGGVRVVAQIYNGVMSCNVSKKNSDVMTSERFHSP